MAVLAFAAIIAILGPPRASATPINASPLASPDAYQTPAGQPLIVDAPGVLGNDVIRRATP